MENAEIKLIKLFDSAIEKISSFKLGDYKIAFEKYYSENSALYDEINEDIKDFSEEEIDEYLNNLANIFVNHFYNEYKEIESKSKKNNYVTEHNTPLVVYVFPGILKFNEKKWSVKLCDLIKDKWNDSFKGLKISYDTFESINGGFKTKLCYITTAICDTLNLDDNCKELSLLRHYRDEILVNYPEGKDIIKEYYNIAPTMVKRINRESNCKEIYETLYKEYISICVNDIENSMFDECKEKYIEMVNLLKSRYINNIKYDR